MVIIWILVFLIVCCVNGCAAMHIAASKGYNGLEEGFWWGFFLGISGLLVVGFKPDKFQTSAAAQPQIPINNTSPATSYQSVLKTPAANASHPNVAPWKCVCGALNSPHSQFCFNCRRTKQEASAQSAADQHIKCKHCGANNSRGKEFCFACNQPLNKD